MSMLRIEVSIQSSLISAKLMAALLAELEVFSFLIFYGDHEMSLYALCDLFSLVKLLIL